LVLEMEVEEACTGSRPPAAGSGAQPRRRRGL